MRKVLWCCAILALQAAAAVFFVAEYARCYPDTTVARCVVTTYHLGMDCNPVYRLSHAAAGKTVAMVQHVKQVASNAAPAPASATVIPADPEPIAAECPHQAGGCPATGHEGTPSPAGGHMLGKIFIPPEQEEPVNADPAPATPPMGGAGEECDSAPPTMPPAADEPSVPQRMPYADEGKEADGPRTMPHAEEGDAAADVQLDASFLEQFYEDEATHCTDEGAAEESEPPQDATPDCREDPNYDLQYPGCPYNGSCPRSECPHTGQCPAHEHSTPSAGEEQNIPPMPESDPDVYLQHKPKYAPREGNSSDYCPPPSRLDTMEFRRSDARPEDFDRFPF
jgi:hypothetical protein